MRLFGGTSASNAVFVTIIVVSSTMVWLVCAGKTGGELGAVTITVKLLVALKGGTPLSVTTVVIVLVLGP